MSVSPHPKNVTELHRKTRGLRPRIAVIGVGGAGCNAINNMISSGLGDVDFIAANTDAQSLAMSKAEYRIQLGADLTEGLGAGSKPEIGEAAAEEAADDIRERIASAHMAFVAAGMGGGTGTGAATIIARIARELGVLTVGVVTTPFLFEGTRRMRVAEAGLEELKKHVDTLIVIPNQNLFRVAHEKTTFSEAFALADQVLYAGVACIVDLIMKEGLINLDFADVRTIMSGMGTAVMGTGEGSGERRAVTAAEEAISNPLLDDISLKGAKGLLLSITGGRNMTLYEVDEAASRIRQEVDNEANIIVGATFDEALDDKVRVSIVASGMALSGGRASETSDAASRARKTAPPPPPAKGAAPADAAEIQRRLSTAISLDPKPGQSAAAAAAQAASRGRSTWRGAGGVTIEDPTPDDDLAFDDLTGDESESGGGKGMSRVPDIEDFPLIGQREYRAKSGARHAGEDADRPNRRLGLFERLTGRTKS